MVDDRTLDYMEGMGLKVLYISGERTFLASLAQELVNASERGGKHD
jgi:hypothetical protein